MDFSPLTTINNTRATYHTACSPLPVSAWVHGLANTEDTPPSFTETIRKEQREKIIEAQEPLQKRVEEATIKVESIEDLVKASEETFKPIIHQTSKIKKEKRKRHTFYVLDADVKYELVIDESTE